RKISNSVARSAIRPASAPVVVRPSAAAISLRTSSPPRTPTMLPMMPITAANFFNGSASGSGPPPNPHFGTRLIHAIGTGRCCGEAADEAKEPADQKPDDRADEHGPVPQPGRVDQPHGEQAGEQAVDEHRHEHGDKGVAAEDTEVEQQQAGGRDPEGEADLDDILAPQHQPRGGTHPRTP